MQEKLLVIRSRRGYSKKFVAEYLSLSAKQYSNKEKGLYAFDGDEMFKLSELFDKSVDDIFMPRCHQNGDKKQ